MDALALQCIAGSKVALLASSSPDLRMRWRRRNCILTPFPAQKFGRGYAILVQRRPIQPLSSSSSAAASTEVEEVASAVETPELTPSSEVTSDTPVETTDDTRTVHVRFILQKECAFGQQFCLVGNDPMCGLWDPSKAVPMEWSSGHVWTAELELPAEREIQYKFIRRGRGGEIKWQHGRDRSLQTWETTKTIVVSEDWHKPEHQKVSEEEEQLVILVEEEEHTKIDVGGEAAVVMDQIQSLEAEENRETAEMSTESDIHEEKLIGEEGLVMVPISASGSGLEGEVAEVSLDEVEHYKSSQSSEEEDDVSGGGSSERSLLKEEIMDASQQSNDGEKSEAMQITNGGVLSEDEILEEEPSSGSAYVLQNDIQWGVQALEQVLTILGLNPSQQKLHDKW